MATTDTVSIWKRTVDHSRPDLTAEQAEHVQKLRFSKSDVRPTRTLGERAHDGTLTDGERVELEKYLSVGRRMCTLKVLMRGVVTAEVKLAVSAPVRRRHRQAS